MTITRRIIKGTALTYEEMDENIRDLRFDTDLTRILENGPTTNLDATYNSTVTVTALNVGAKTIKEYIEDTVGDMFVGHQGADVTATYSDSAGTITITVDHPEAANGAGGGGDTTIVNQGATSLSGLDDVSLGTLQSGQVLKYNGTAWVNGTDNSSGTGSSSFLGLSDTPVSFGSAGQVVRVNSSGNGLEFGTVSGGGGGSLARTTETETSSVSAGQSANLTFASIGITYALLKVAVSGNTWARLYTSSTERTNDAGRSVTTDPSEGSGLIAEFVNSTSSTKTFLVSPGVIGWTDDSTVPARVTNIGSSTITASVAITAVPMEQ